MTFVAYVACAFIWGTTWFAIRVSMPVFATFTGLAMRMTLAAAILGGIWAATGAPSPRTRRQRLGMVLAGLLNGVNYSLVYLGEEQVTGAVAAIIFGTLPLITAVLAMLTRAERVRGRAVVGALVGLVGNAIIFADRVQVSADQGRGVLVIFIAVCAAATWSLIMKQSAGDTHPVVAATFLVASTASVAWLLAVFAREPLPAWPPALGPTLALLYLTVFGSVVAFASYTFLLKRVALMTAATLVFIEPLIALAIDAAWEQSPPTPRIYLGAAVTLCGVAVSAAKSRQSPASAASATPAPPP